MSSSVKLLTVGAVALALSVVCGSMVHSTRENHLGFTHDDVLEVDNVGDVLRAALWETRVGLSDLTFLEASLVFHRGLRNEEELFEEPTPLHPWVPEHVHDMDHVGEMMPWIWLTTNLNPHHTRAYAMGGYFLSWRLDQTDEALAYLAEGEANNPGDGLIPFTIGKIYLLHIHDAEAAIEPLRRAVACDAAGDEEDTLASVRLLAHALRIAGQWQEGVDLWQREVASHPTDPAYTAGFDAYMTIVNDPATRQDFSILEVSDETLLHMEEELCAFGESHDLEHDHDHDHDDHSD